MTDPGVEMPRYKCHKEVWALQIAAFEPFVLTFIDMSYAPKTINPDVVSRYLPEPGDYYVVSDDGYASISPKKAFEEGYTRIVR